MISRVKLEMLRTLTSSRADRESEGAPGRTYSPVSRSTCSPWLYVSLGDNVTIYGDSFGPVGVLTAVVNVTLPAPTSDTVTCTSATVTVDHTQLTCTMPAGTGASNPLSLYMTANGTTKSVTSTALTYAKPIFNNATQVGTAGGPITIKGSNFGPKCASATAAAACVTFTFTSTSAGSVSTSTAVGDVTVADSTIVLGMPAGTGYFASSQMVGKIQGQTGAVYFNFQYLGPTILAVIQPPSIFGSSFLIFNGTNFGPATTLYGTNTPTVSVSQVTNANISSLYPCTIYADHTIIKCPVSCSTPCVGNYGANGNTTYSNITVTINGQKNVTSSAILLFEGPVINGIRGSITAVSGQMSFLGSSGYDAYVPSTGYGPTEQLVIEGRNFGAQSGSDSSLVYYVKVCPKTTNAACKSSDYINATTLYRALFSTYAAFSTSVISSTACPNCPLCAADTNGFAYTTYPCTEGANSVGSLVVASLPDATTAANAWSVLVAVSGGGVNITSGSTGDGLLTFVGPSLTSSTTSGYVGVVGNGLAPTTACGASVAATDPTTAGGTLVLCGKRLGTAANSFSLPSWDTTGYLSTGSYASFVSMYSNDTQIAIAVPVGMGYATFYLSVTNNASLTMSSLSVKFLYAAPNITSVSLMSTTGGTITIVGSSFGPLGTNGQSVPLDQNSNPLVSVYLYYGTTTAGVTTRGTVLGQCTSVKITVAHTTLTCTAPAGVGSGLWVLVTVAGVTNTAANQQTPGAAYASPNITSIAQVPTSGTSISGTKLTIYGVSMGTTSTTVHVAIQKGSSQTVDCYTTADSSNCCLNAQVTASDGTALTCTAPQGSGYPFFINVTLGTLPNAKSAVLSGNLVYLSPNVTAVSAVPYWGSTYAYSGIAMTITGTNFGCCYNDGLNAYAGTACSSTCTLSTSNPVVVIGDNQLSCSGAVVTIAHKQIVCNAPAYLDYLTLSSVRIGVTVGGLSTATVSSGTKKGLSTYTFSTMVGPVITSATSVSAFGGTCNVTGTGFGLAGTTNIQGNGGTIAAGSILINNQAISLTSASPSVTTDDTVLSFTAPAGTGTNLPLAIVIRGISTPTKYVLTYVGPRITAVQGCYTSGSNLVTIYGKNFGPTGTSNFDSGYPTITCSGCSSCGCASPVQCTSATVSVADTAITCSLSSVVGFLSGDTNYYTGSWDVALSMSGNTDNSTGTGTFLFAAPSVTSISPTSGGYATTITVTGTSFGADTSIITVYIVPSSYVSGGVVTTYTSNNLCTSITFVTSHTQFTCSAPRWAGTSQALVVLVNGQYSGSSVTFSYSSPVISSVTSISTAGGTVTITGTYFGPVGGATITTTIGSATCSSPTVITADTTVTCSLPAATPKSAGGAFSTADLYGTNGNGVMSVYMTVNGQPASNNGSFSFTSATVTSVSPLVQVYGSLVTVTGTNFGSAASTIGVMVCRCGTTSCNVAKRCSSNSTVAIVTSNTKFTFTMPIGSGVNNTFNMTVSGRAATLASTPTVISYSTPVISGSYDGAPITGGSTNIRGTGFGPLGSTFLSSVIINGSTSCTSPSVTIADTQITCTMVAGTGGPFNVTVVVDGQSSGNTGMNNWAYTGATLSGVSPNTSVVNGTILTITGQNMAVPISQISAIITGPGDGYPKIGFPCTNVSFVSTCAVVNNVNPVCSITCTAPLSVGKNLDVVLIVNTVYSTTSNTSKISYKAPNITSISPAVTDGLTLVTIYGTGFGPFTNNTQGTSGESSYFDYVYLNGQSCTSPAVIVADSAITCYPPAGSNAGYDASLSMRSATSGTTGKGKFSYAPPNITGIVAPPVIYGGTVSILGVNFGPAVSSPQTNVTVGIYNGETVTANCTATGGVPMWGYGGCAPTLLNGGCTNVTVVSHNVVTCQMTHGTGWQYDIYITVMSQNSNTTGAKMFHYAAPKLSYIIPTVPSPSGTLMSIHGINFGYDYEYAQLAVTVGGVACTALDQSTQYILALRDPNNPTIYKEPSTIVIAAPYTTGYNLSVLVSLNGQFSAASDGVVFSYSVPTVSSSTQVDTIGGNITITGLGFGPAGTPASVTVGGASCTSGFVSVSSTAIICNMPPGTGANLTVIVATGPVGNQISSLGAGNEGKFTYNAPTVQQITPVVAAAGGVVTVFGNNYGYTASKVAIGIYYPSSAGSGVWYSTQQVVPGANPHTSFSFYVPFGFSHDLRVTVTVDGQSTIAPSTVLFSYSSPVVVSATSSPTVGGLITVTGLNFGPAFFAGAVDFVRAYDANRVSPNPIPCILPVVTTNNTVLTCYMGPGVGQSLGMSASVGGLQSSVATGVYKYNPPIVRNVLPVFALAGDVVNVTGDNFGPWGTGVQVTVGGVFTSATAYLTQAHSNLSFIMPTGAGKNLFVSVNAPIGSNVTTGSTQTSQAIKPTNGQSVTISFITPIVQAATSAPTSGGLITISGLNFGPIGQNNINSVLVNGASCANANVTFASAAICTLSCVVAAGTGASKPVLVNLGAQTSIGGTSVYSYAAPVVSSVTPRNANAGTVVTIAGSSFGVDPTLVTVNLGPGVCASVVVVTPHVLLTCVVPNSSGKNISVGIVVDGNVGPTTFGLFGYYAVGCLNPAAANYNSQATSSGNCTILGCTNTKSYNYAANANTDDGSCVASPTLVTMTTTLDYNTYSVNASYYNGIMTTTIATQLSLNVSRVINMTGNPGSTVFTFYITDQSNSPASTAVANLQNMVINNQFTLSSVLGTLLNIVVSTPGAQLITTAATQQYRFSVASIAGICAGAAFLIVWLIFWRPIVMFITTRYCKPREEPSKLYEVDVYTEPVSSPSSKDIISQGEAAPTTAPKVKAPLRSLRDQHQHGGGKDFHADI